MKMTRIDGAARAWAVFTRSRWLEIVVGRLLPGGRFVVYLHAGPVRRHLLG